MTPGLDGFPVEFYKLYKSVLLEHLVGILTYILNTDLTPSPLAQSILVVFSKNTKDLTVTASYQPIALVNQDAKTFSATLGNRLKCIITDYVHTDQSSFIPSRNQFTNIHKPLNIIHHCSSLIHKAILLLFDFEKAFDLVEVPYMKILLRHIAFGDF